MNDNFAVDLHMHSSISDGEMTPVEVIDTAAEHGLTVVVLADHNALHENFSKLKSYAGSKGVCIPFAGCEVSALYYACGKPYIRFHLLVYGKEENIRDRRFTSLIEQVDAAPNKAVMRDLSLLQERGVPVSFRELFILDPEVAPTEKSMKNADDYLCVKVGEKLGISPEEVMAAYGVGQGGCWGDDELSVRPDAEAVIAAAKSAGLVTVMAHPAWVDGATEELDSEMCDEVTCQMIRHLASLGLDGVEVFHQVNDGNWQSRLTDLAGELGLITTGGSDFHGRLTGYGSYLTKFGATEAQFKAITELVEERSASAF